MSEPRIRGRPVAASLDTEPAGSAPFGAALALSVILAAGGFCVLMPSLLLVVHPVRATGLGILANLVNQQNQTAKTFLYVIAFAVLLPLAISRGPRLADRLARTATVPELNGLVATLTASFAGMLILVRLSASLPWGDGLETLLAGGCIWLAVAGMLLFGARTKGRWRLVKVLTPGPALFWGAGAIVLAVGLCVTSLGSLSLLGLIIGAAAGTVGVAAYRTWRLPRAGVGVGRGLDLLAIAILLLAIPDLVVFTASGGLPNIFFPPGVIQFQHDWILGPTNQLLGGGAVLVNVPASQYGVGLMYFVAAWFHIVPIGYGTFGLLDGLLTAGVYIAAYVVLRLVGVGRLLAGVAIALAVVVLLYNLPYSVGALPEEGPLRFGLPMAVILARAAEARWPRHAAAARIAGFAVLAVSSVWALEAFAYTTFTLAAGVALEVWLLAPSRRRHRVAVQAGFAVGAILAAHLLLAGATVVGTGRLPDWTQYLGYLRALLLGGHEGSITYGFSRWSPGLIVGLADFASAAGVVLLVRRRPSLARGRSPQLIALAGSTAYAIASLSYTDNRSSTYLLLYTSLPTLIAATLWLSLLLSPSSHASPRLRTGSLAFALGVAALMLAAAWPAAGAHFSRTALAKAYPGSGLTSALSRLEHPPPIDPRAPGGEALLKRYLPRGRPLILLPAAPDLAVEIELRARRVSPLFIGDPSQDVFVPAVWMPVITRQISRLRPGLRVLTDRSGLRDLRILRDRPDDYVIGHPLPGHNPQPDWILHQLDRRFRLVQVATGSAGLIVVRLAARR